MTLIINTRKRIQVISYFVGKLAFVISQILSLLLSLAGSLTNMCQYFKEKIKKKKSFEPCKCIPLYKIFKAQFSG